MAMTEVDVLAVVDVLEERAIPVSVAGGWAVDALVGRVTREHGDLDSPSTPRWSTARSVSSAGSACTSTSTRDRHDSRSATAVGRSTSTRSPGAPMARGYRMKLAGERSIYPPGSTDAAGRIGGRTVRCLTPELLIAFHLGYEPRPIDRQDMAALARQFDLELPPPY